MKTRFGKKDDPQPEQPAEERRHTCRLHVVRIYRDGKYLVTVKACGQCDVTEEERTLAYPDAED